MCVEGVEGGGGGRGQRRSRDQLFVNSLFGLVFIHRGLVTWYVKNRCVNCFYQCSVV